MARLVELDCVLRVISDGERLIQKEVNLRDTTCASASVIDLTLAAQTVRQRISEARGARALLLEASAPIIVYFGNSAEGHTVEVLLLKGAQLTEGITVSAPAESDVTLLILR